MFTVPICSKMAGSWGIVKDDIEALILIVVTMEVMVLRNHPREIIIGLVKI